MKKDSITSDNLISYVCASTEKQAGVLVTYDVPTKCPACNKCLKNKYSGRCMVGGPFRGYIEL